MLGILVAPIPFGRLLLPLGVVILVILLRAAAEEPAELRAGEEVPPIRGLDRGRASQRRSQVPAHEPQRPGGAGEGGEAHRC